MKYHTFVSILKSAIRIIGFAVLLENITAGVSFLILAEIVGIVEEIEP